VWQAIANKPGSYVEGFDPGDALQLSGGTSICNRHRDGVEAFLCA
jgi:hypothetical protein